MMFEVTATIMGVEFARKGRDVAKIQYTYVYVCMYIDMFTYVYIYIYTHIYIYVYIHVYMHIVTRINMQQCFSCDLRDLFSDVSRAPRLHG